jgi:site-specific DNA-methyltransferase (cytosine-N4-specific)
MNAALTDENLSTADVARLAGVHKDTLLRWLRSGLVQEPGRDRHGWRFFSGPEAQAVVAYAKSAGPGPLSVQQVTEPRAVYLGKLAAIDWSFADAKTTYLTHGIHPYPAKFIPQIPNALIQELSSVGDTVGDIFCGSGTTLVEALTLKRHAVGVDANPLACLISKAKTSQISNDDAVELADLAQRARVLGDSLLPTGEGELFPSARFTSTGWRPSFEKLEFWFVPHVIEELAEILSWCREASSGAARNLALVAFSAIIVSVSKQDSDTRYVRREKNVPTGETFRRFARSLEQATRAAAEFSELVEERFRCEVLTANLLQSPGVPKLDLLVCSPPYPNAYSYHLYHMTRMIWLGMDQPKFKREEIGSHRKYSSNGKNGATVDTFAAEFSTIFQWLSKQLRISGYACFVVGDSTLKGKRVNNANIICEAGRSAGFVEVMRADREMQATKKAFNPAIGKIKTETILVLENRGGAV